MTATAFSHLSTLSDPTRARLLLALDGHELSVGELAVALQLPQSTVSRHLKVLGDDGWVTTRPNGTSRYYQKADALGPRAGALWGVVRDDLAEGTGARLDLERVDAVIAERRQRSREFFSSVAGNWQDLRHELFGKSLDLTLMAALADPDSVVGDLGCGDGRLAERLAPWVRRVVAVDVSTEMLTAARSRLAEHGNVEVRQSELERLPIESHSLDLAILALVLHHLAEPAVALAEAVRTLKPGGRLIVLDMAPHDREELRRSMGHAWAGFAEGQMREWMTQAGLVRVAIRPVPADPEARGPGLFLASGTRAGDRAGNRTTA